MLSIRSAVNSLRGALNVATRGFAKGKEKAETFSYPLPEAQYHLLDSTLPETVDITKEEMTRMYESMFMMRRMELAADQMYKAKLIRGFCHLYDGQEAIAIGMEDIITKDDYVITAYRDHCQQLGRGDTVQAILAELAGKATGSSKGKGGSMHMYKKDANFYGGNGIVGAQCPVGTGLAFAAKYYEQLGLPREGVRGERVCITMFGDGASNQGQLFEAMNMASLWKLPVVYVLENNQFGMGTSKKRSSSNTDFYARYDQVPGLKVDGMDCIAAREAFRIAVEHCKSGAGPVLMEMDTYRYHGHSMSDPGLTYRSRDDVSSVRRLRDPVDRLKKYMVESGAVSVEEVKEIEKAVKSHIDAARKFAEESPIPEDGELYADVEIPNPEYVRGVESGSGFGQRDW